MTNEFRGIRYPYVNHVEENKKWIYVHFTALIKNAASGIRWINFFNIWQYFYVSFMLIAHIHEYSIRNCISSKPIIQHDTYRSGIIMWWYKQKVARKVYYNNVTLSNRHSN